jgi:hypothetical protein
LPAVVSVSAGSFFAAAGTFAASQAIPAINAAALRTLASKYLTSMLVGSPKLALQP